MTTEDNYNKPTRTVQDWIAEGYTEAYAKALYAQQKEQSEWFAKKLEYKKRNASAFYSVWDPV